jgi:hypothetical protein
MAYKAYVTQLKNVRKHPNADRLLLGDCFGNTVCVNLNTQKVKSEYIFQLMGNCLWHSQKRTTY